VSLAVGDNLGPYEILAPIGAGGMGEVYRAKDTKLGRDVAIKVLPAALAQDPERLARFEREAKVLASLNHPNIAHIYGIEDRALVMELVEGQTLKAPLPVETALNYAKQIADALEAAHEKGIIHRDLKPANIMITPEGVVKVLDFGLATVTQASGESQEDPNRSPTLTMRATQAGMIMGTAAYMSPEQAAGKPVDKRADIWSFGVVLWEMLSGQRMFDGETISDTLADVLRAPIDFDKLPKTTPHSVRVLVKRCLDRDVKSRLRDIGEARVAIQNVGKEPEAPVRPAKTTWSSGRLPCIAAAVLAVVAAGTSWIAYRSTRPADTLVRFTVPPPPDAERHALADFAVSPDGQLLAFTAEGADGVSRIFVRRFDTAETQPLAGTERATDLFWAPDSRSLGFAKESGLYRSDPGARQPKRLCDVPANGLYGGTWGSGGVIVFASQANGLFRIPDTGGTPEPVTTLDSAAKEGGHVGPWFLPDGRHLLFLALAVGQTRGIIWATSIDNRERTRIVESSGPAAYADGWLLFTTAAPRVLVVQPFDPKQLRLHGVPQPVRDRLPGPTTGGSRGFAVSESGSLVVDRPSPIMSQLEWMDRTGRTVATLGPRAGIRSFALAPDERRVVAAVQDYDAGRSDVWLFDAEREGGTRLTYEGSVMRPLWAPDGRHIYLTEVQPFGLRTLALGAPQATVFENPGRFRLFEDVTRDGRYLVFKSSPPLSEIWIQRVGSAGERRALVQGPFAAMQPRVSPDSRWVAYTYNIPSGSEVFVQPFDRPGERIQVSVKGGGGPVWRDDGRELYYEGPEGLMVVPMNERSGALEAGTPQKLFSIHTQGGVVNQPHNVEVAAHGQKFLVNTIVGDSDNVPLEVTLNWTAALKK
jgi:eukaryotic-like serine/threonine-protein kinase